MILGIQRSHLDIHHGKTAPQPWKYRGRQYFLSSTFQFLFVSHRYLQSLLFTSLPLPTALVISKKFSLLEEDIQLLYFLSSYSFFLLLIPTYHSSPRAKSFSISFVGSSAIYIFPSLVLNTSHLAIHCLWIVQAQWVVKLKTYRIITIETVFAETKLNQNIGNNSNQNRGK